MNYSLLNLPLFQGLSRDDLLHIAEVVPLSFQQHKKGDVLSLVHEHCDKLIFVLYGKISVTMHANNNSYTLIEELHSPWMIEPEQLFGLQQQYTRTYKAETNCNTLSIKKKHVLYLSEKHMVFHINLLNILSTQAQRLLQRAWQPAPTNLQQRIIRFIKNRCLYPAGKKVFKIKMTQLAALLNDSRLDISVALNDLQSQQLIKLTRGHITVMALEKL